MPLSGINNFSAGQNPNTNNIKALGYLFGAIMTKGSWNNGCAVTATPTPDGFVNVGTGHVVFNIGPGSALVFYNTASEKVAITPNPNNDGSVVFNLVYAKLDLQYDLGGLPTVSLGVEVGGVNTDPALPNDPIAGIFCVPLCRVAKTYSSTGVVVTSEIITAGNTNNGTVEPIRPISTLGGTVLFLTQAEIDSRTFPAGTIIFNTTANDFMVSDGQTYNLKKNKSIWTLISPIPLGTYTAASVITGQGTFATTAAPVPRTSPATVFDDILNGATGTGNLTIPANSLRVGDQITITGIIQSTHGAISTSNSVGNNAQIFIRFGGVPETWLNNITYRRSTLATGGASYTGFLVYTGASSGGTIQAAAFPETINSTFKLIGTVTKTGVNGQIIFSETGDVLQVNNNGSWLLAGRHSGVGNCQPATIDTTINNPINFDFRVYRGGQATFAPTYTLTNLTITLN